MRQRQEALRARSRELQARAHAERSRHASVDASFEMVDRDGEVGGGIIAGALAYRLFIWLLPLALVAVAGLGIAAQASSTSPRAAANSVGLAGIVTNSIAQAAEGTSRWYALIIGLPVLFLATRSVLRVLIGAHRLIWGDVRAEAPKPTPKMTLRFFGLLLCYWALVVLAATIRHHSPGLGLLTLILMAVLYGGLWLVISLQLPHRKTPWVHLVPGALLVGLGVEVMHAVSVYFIAPYAVNKQGTYGALGLAAALLVGLFMLARLIVGAAIVNATLWERHARNEPPPAAPRPGAT
jgi:uncharacterized BrkB/YihY/UPF0761 family membrane protein